jgi:hypothetical protein
MNSVSRPKGYRAKEFKGLSNMLVFLLTLSMALAMIPLSAMANDDANISSRGGVAF